MNSDQTTPKPGPSSDVQGEGDYDAARRHREAAEGFVRNHDVEQAGREAEPQDADELKQLEDAEAEGRSHAKK